MSRVIGHAESKYVTGARHASSESLHWDGILAETWTHEPGQFNDTLPAVTEVIVMLRGSIEVRRRGDGQLQNHTASPGTVWLCPAGIQEDLIRVKGSSFDAVHIFLPAQPLSTTMLEEFDLDPSSVQIRYEGGFKDPLIQQMACSLQRELEDPGPGSELMVDSMRTALSAYVIRRYSSVEKRAEKQARSQSGALDQKRLCRAKAYIEDNLSQTIRLSDIASEAHLSPYHFSRAFKCATGLSPYEYVTARRLQCAQEMIMSSSLALESIAQLNGFSSHAHMSRVFTRSLGMTPVAIRKIGRCR